MINWLRRHVASATGLLLVLLVFIVYSTILSHLLIYMEQHRLFRFSMAYVAEELHQAGAAKLAGDFVVQFFYYPVLGAAILALLFGVVYICVADGLRRLIKRRGPVVVVPALVLPAIFLAKGATVDAPIEPLTTALMWTVPFWIVSAVAGRFIKRQERELSARMMWVTLGGSVLILGAAAIYALTKVYEPMERDIVLIEAEYRRGDDDAVVRRANRYLRDGGRVHVVPYFRNLSLLRQGKLAEHAFDFPPLFGVNSLYVHWDGHVLKREYGYHVYHLLGSVNMAQRWRSEGMTNLGETGPILSDLAAYYIINGHDRVASRAINHLSQSLFYRSTADSLRASLGTGRVAGVKNFYAEAPDSINGILEDDFLPSTGHMLLTHPDDKMVAEIFLTGCLLAGDYNNFLGGLNLIGMRDPEKMPRPYREALAMIQAGDPSGWWRDAGFKVWQPDIDRYMEFSKAVKSGNKLALKSAFADTYWYYFFFINPDRPNKNK